MRSAILIAAALLFASGLTAADEGDEEKQVSRWTLEGGFLWTEPRGNDVLFGDTIATDVTLEENFPSLTQRQEDRFERLFNELGGDGAPYARFSYQGGKWGASGDFWSVGNEGSLSGTAEGVDETIAIWGSRFREDFDLDFAGRNELSVWSARAAVTRSFPHSLYLSAGVHVARLDLSRAESVTGVSELEPLFFLLFDEAQTFEGATSARVKGTGAGPVVELRWHGDVRSRLQWTVSGSQSFLFSSMRHAATYASLNVDEVFLLPVDLIVDAAIEGSSRVVVPVTELRTDLKLMVGEHLGVGMAAFLSVWQDVPQALEFDFAHGWAESRATLVFVQVGPVVSLGF